MRIDAHQHFWKLSRRDYGWLTPDLTPLYRDFLPADLQGHLARNDIDGTILVQAADSLAETEFMLELAAQHDWILGVVGWVPLDQSNAIEILGQLSKHPKFRGIRPMLQDIADTDWILSDAPQPVLNWLSDNKLAFDALIEPRHLQVIDRLASRHPDLTLILDHAAKPDIENHMWEDWQTGLAKLSTHPNCFCKLSGLVTETGASGTLDDTAPYIKEVLGLFAHDRVIWGSDWPVCTLRTRYQSWYDFCKDQTQECSDSDRAAFFGLNAARAYRLPVGNVERTR